MAQTYKAQVDPIGSFEVPVEEAIALDLSPDTEQWEHLLADGHAYRVRLTAANFAKKTYTVQVGGNRYTVRLMDELDQQIERMGFQLQSARNVARIEAPMPGLILSVHVSPGDYVTEGTPLVVLEAMKMENAILAPQDGEIKHVAVQQGEAVEKKSLLVEFKS